MAVAVQESKEKDNIVLKFPSSVIFLMTICVIKNHKSADGFKGQLRK